MVPPATGRSSQATTSDMLVRARAEVRRRYRQVHRLLAEQGTRGVKVWLQRAVGNRLAPTRPLDVRPVDVLAADIRVRRLWSQLPFDGEGPLVVNWVMSPPSRGSGGHTTIFRLIEHLERAGHVCRVYIYDLYGADAAFYAHHVRKVFPRFSGEVHDVTD